MDLDDTLIKTSQYYQEAVQELVKLMEDNFGIEEDQTLEVFSEVNHQVSEQDGLKKSSFPRALKETAQQLVDNPDQELLNEIEEEGYQTFKTESGYRRQGFMNGAKEMLDKLSQKHADELHLVTVGDPEVQQPKINALGLDQWFDHIHICSHNTGKGGTFATLMKSNGFTPDQFYHIGNSASSDVEPAINQEGHAVYISQELDWMSTENLHNSLLKHSRVYPFKTAKEFTQSIEEVLGN